MKSQRGNVLFLILIAVALFAALSRVVLHSSRVSGGSISDEDATLRAAEILQYAAHVKTAVDKIRIMNGVGENEISFENAVHLREDGSPRSPASDYPNCDSIKCRVFHPGDGGVIPKAFGEGYALVNASLPVNGTSAGHSRFVEQQIVGVGSEANELVLTINYLEPKVCAAINRMLGIPNDGNNVPVDAARTSGSYTSYQNNMDTVTGWTIGEEWTPFAGKASFCTHWNDTSLGSQDYDYVFYQVLLER